MKSFYAAWKSTLAREDQNILKYHMWKYISGCRDTREILRDEARVGEGDFTGNPYPFDLCIKRSEGKGLGLFVHNGVVPKGSICAIYPGSVYLSGDPLFLVGLRNDYLLRMSNGSTIDGKPFGLSSILFKSNWEKLVDRVGMTFLGDESLIDFDSANRQKLLSGSCHLCSESTMPILNFGNYANHAPYGDNNADYVEKSFCMQDFIFCDYGPSDDRDRLVPFKKDFDTNLRASMPRILCFLPYVHYSHFSVADVLRRIHDNDKNEGTSKFLGVALIANRDIEAGEEILCCYDDIVPEEERLSKRPS